MSCDGWINIEKEVIFELAPDPHFTCYECGKRIVLDPKENKKIHARCKKCKLDDSGDKHLRVNYHSSFKCPNYSGNCGGFPEED